MKFIESVDLEYVNQALEFETSDCRVIGRIEPYSCKATGCDKKLFKLLEHKYSDDTMDGDNHSPVNSYNGSIQSPFGPLDQQSSRKTFYYLISTLNATFPDYEFSDLKPHQFIKINSLQMVMNSINQTLISAGGQSIINSIGLWDTIDYIIQLHDTDIYSYLPDMDTDPFAENGNIWSFNYFFFNKKLKRIVFFTCRCVSLKNRTDEGLGQSLYENESVDDGFMDDLDIEDHVLRELDF